MIDRLYSPPRMEVPFVSEKGRTVLAATAPEPLHLLSALLGYGELTTADKFAAIKLAVRLRLGQQARADESVEARGA